jgi:SanA protein
MKILKYLSILVIVSLLIFLTPFILMQVKYRIFNNRSIEPKVAIIFGAGLVNSRPSQVLASRLNEGVVLYKANKITKIIVSGDNSTMYYNEPLAMTDYLISKGVEEADIIQDFAGRRTVDTCYRAKQVFNVNSAYLISQPFHLPRALWLCENYGIMSKTVGAANLPFFGTVYQYIREVPSSFKALFESFNYKDSEPSDGKEIRVTE